MRNATDACGLILMYHRIGSEGSDPWSLCVDSGRFAEHLTILQNLTTIVQLTQMVKMLSKGELNDRTIAITFDDGYADNLHQAKPLLERYELPATVYVVSGHIGQEREFWSDELEGFLLTPGPLPRILRIQNEDVIYEWDLGTAMQYTENDHRKHMHWKGWEDPPTLRHAVYVAIWKMLRPLTENKRRMALDQLWQLKGDLPLARNTHRTLTNEEVRDLAQDDLIEIGSHTVTHPKLCDMTESQQNHELHHSKMMLEKITGKPVLNFAYPYGWHGDFTQETASLVRDAGFTSACSAIPGLIEKDTDSFQMPRVQIHNWKGAQFRAELEKWFSRLP